MKKRSIGGVILSILLGIIAALLIAAVVGYFVIKQVILPRYTQRLSENGHSEIAQAVEDNANLGTLASLGSLLSDRDVMNFLKNINRENAKSVLEVLDELEQDYADEEEQPTASVSNTANETWQVKDILPIPTPVPAPPPTPEAPQEETPANTASPSVSGSTAYERIAAAATAEEMSDGLKIISKLDMSYVSSLTAGGLTAEEKKELKAYVQATLTSAEISRAMALYKAYSKYL